MEKKTENEWIDFSSAYLFRLDFGTVPTVWYFLFYILLIFVGNLLFQYDSGGTCVGPNNCTNFNDGFYSNGPYCES